MRKNLYGLPQQRKLTSIQNGKEMKTLHIRTTLYEQGERKIKNHENILLKLDWFQYRQIKNLFDNDKKDSDSKIRILK